MRAVTAGVYLRGASGAAALPTFVGLAALALGGCQSPAPGVDLTKPPVVDTSQSQPPDLLSAYNLFSWDAEDGFTFNETGERIVPYTLNTPLFSDYALKQRAIYIPPGQAATFDPEHAFDLPVGAALIKTFSFAPDLREPTVGVQLVETRLLIHYPDGWEGFPYIWNAAQTDAVYSPAGETRTIAFTDDLGSAQTSDYLVPEKNQCEACHSLEGSDGTVSITPIGIKARHLDRDYDYGSGAGSANQLSQLVAQDMLSGLPDLSTITPAYDFSAIESGGVAAIPATDVDAAARSYLDINCAHCHNPNGVNGITTQLFLNHDNTVLFNLGVCKRPGSAGNGTGGFTYDIVPGDPAQSILYFRDHTTQVGAMMPLLGRSVTHAQGAGLLYAWIAAMPAQVCQ